MSSASNFDVVGIDFGATNCRLTHLFPKKHMPTILRNSLGNENTPAIASYVEGEQRLAGETALGKDIAKPKNTIQNMKQALCVFDKSGGGSVAAVSSQIATNACIVGDEKYLGFEFPSDGEECQFDCDKKFPWTQTAQQVLGFQLRQILLNAPSTAAAAASAALEKGSAAASSASIDRHIAIAVPQSTSSLYRQVYVESAARIAGVDPKFLHLVEEPTAVALYFHHLRFKDLPAAATGDMLPTRVAIVNVGETSSFAVLLDATQAEVTILAQSADSCLGTRDIDGAIAAHIVSSIQKKHKVDVSDHLKSMNKVRREAGKAKVMLSTTEKAIVSLESLKDGVDVTLEIKRSDLDHFAAPVLQRIADMLAPIAAADSALKRVEVIGNGWRAPIIQNLVKRTFPTVSVLGMALDANTSVAEGACIAVAVEIVSGAAAAAEAAAAAAERQKDDEAAGALPASPMAPDGVSITHQVKLVTLDGEGGTKKTQEQLSESERANLDKNIAAWREAEGKMQERDSFFELRLRTRNDLERNVLELLDQVEAITPDAAKRELLRAAVLTYDDWLRDAGDSADVTTEVLAAKKKAFIEHMEREFPDVQAHRAKLEEEQRAKDEELTRLAATREESRELKSDPQRLKVAAERKTQGQKLFQEEHFEEAASRFVQAVAILAEVYDTKEHATERDNILLSCYLNIASCSIKLKRWRNALNNASKAIEISPEHPKAFFRRGQAQRQLGEFAAARLDLEKAMGLSSGDTAVQSELAALQADIDAEKSKEKKMYGKMFG